MIDFVVGQPDAKEFLAEYERLLRFLLPRFQREGKSYLHIAIGCTLAYLDFRLPELEWRREHPKVGDWFAEFAQRPLMLMTGPERA